MNRFEAERLIDDALCKIQSPSPNDCGSPWQCGGTFWRLANVLEQHVLPALVATEREHALFLLRQHGIPLVRALLDAVELAARHTRLTPEDEQAYKNAFEVNDQAAADAIFSKYGYPPRPFERMPDEIPPIGALPGSPAREPAAQSTDHDAIELTSARQAMPPRFFP